MTILNKHAPSNQKYIRDNDNLFVTKEMRKAIMTRSKLRNRYYKLKTVEAEFAYKRQGNICTTLLKKSIKSIKKILWDLNPLAVTDNKKIWKVVKPLFSDKVTTRDNIILLDNNEICDNDFKVAEILKTFFSMAVANLKIRHDKIVNCISAEPDPVLNAIEHPNIKKIEEQVITRHSFSFSHVTVGDIINAIADLDETKATPKDCIPPKLIKEKWDIFTLKRLIDFIVSVDHASFPNTYKFEDVFLSRPLT